MIGWWGKGREWGDTCLMGTVSFQMMKCFMLDRGGNCTTLWMNATEYFTFKRLMLYYVNFSIKKPTLIHPLEELKWKKWQIPSVCGLGGGHVGGVAIGVSLNTLWRTIKSYLYLFRLQIPHPLHYTMLPFQGMKQALWNLWKDNYELNQLHA